MVKPQTASPAWVDPELRPALAAMPNLDILSDATLPDIRASLAGAAIAASDDEISVQRVALRPSDAEPELSGILYRPASLARPSPAILNIHGGGYVAGDAAREDAAMRTLALALSCIVLSVDYRLAPEAPFPAAFDDCLAALDWLHAQDGAIDPARVAIRGVSAGGGLAAATALAWRDRKGPPLAHLSLLYPMLDDREGAGAQQGQHVWTPRANRYGWNAYLAGKPAPSAYAAPARADDLSGLPPTFIATGSIDLFFAENMAFAQRLAEAGAPLEMHVYPGAYHGFNLVKDSAAAKHYDAAVLDAFRRHLAKYA